MEQPLGTIRQLSSVDSAPSRGVKQRIPSTPLNVLSRQVAFEFCRMRLLNADSVTDVVAAIDPASCVLNTKEKRRDIPRMWHHVANGKYAYSVEQLTRMEAVAPGTIAILNHVFWPLLADELLSRAKLIDAIRRLPIAFMNLLLDNPDPRTGHVGVQTIGDYELFGVQSLGSLDAVAALLAASHLCEEIGFTEAMLSTARAGIQLFLRIALSGPFARHLARIWSFIERQYVTRLELYDLKPYQRIQDDYRLALDIGGQFSIFGGLLETEHLNFLQLADRWYFGNIVSLLKEAEPKPGKNYGFAKYPPMLQILVVTHEEFGLHQADLQLHSGPYPRDSFEEFDRSMRQEMPEHTRLDYYPEPPQDPEDRDFDLRL